MHQAIRLKHTTPLDHDPEGRGEHKHLTPVHGFRGRRSHSGHHHGQHAALPFRARMHKLAYRHKPAELVIYVLFASGLLLWSPLQIAWQTQRWALSIHMALGIALFWVTVGVFWWAHRKLLMRSRKAWLRFSGRVLEVMLMTLAVTGVILFFHGNPGDMLGRVSHLLHLFISFFMTALLLSHAWRWTVLRLRRRHR
ncbi:hypothetical protein [Pokkaliibacter plantistimulans]|nr:hypothetical protein [Pokkaliibacter plantistimulans]